MSDDARAAFNHPLARWPDVEASLRHVDLARLRRTVVARLGSRSRDALKASAWQREVELLLQQELGAWYGSASWHVGFESFGGCWCHSFVRALAESPEQGADWVLDELQALLDCVRAFEAIFDEKRRDPTFGWDHAIEGIYAVVLDKTGCNESWYGYLEHGLCWLFEACAAKPLNPEWVDGVLSAVCRSWVEPDRASWEAFKRELVSEADPA